jgi:hypothetical protein
MKRVLCCSLLLVGLYGCQRICGDLQAVVELEPTGGGDGGAGRDGGAGGDGRATAGDGGAPQLLAGSGPGGAPSEAGGGAGGDSGGASGNACSTPDSAEIIDFEDAPSSPALGEMSSDIGSPDDQVVLEMVPAPSHVYHEVGTLADQSGIGFSFTFNSCIDPALYAGIQFEARGRTPAGVDVSILPTLTSKPDNAFNFQVDPMNRDFIVVCVPFAVDQKTVAALRFNYARPGSAASDVDFFVDNFVFYQQGTCPGT